LESPRWNVFRLLPVMGSSVRTEFRIFRWIWSRFSGLPRIVAFQMPTLDESPGRPVDCIFRLLPRLNLRVAPQFRLPRLVGWWLIGLPQFPHLPAMPVVSCRVAPVPRSSGCACCGGSSRPESRTLQRSRRSGPGSPLAFDPPPHPLHDSPGCPVSSLVRLRRRWSFGVPLARIFRVCRLASSR